MSIEALIQAHTEALLANTEAVKLLTLSLAGRTPKAEDKPKAEKAAAKVETKPAAKVEELKEELKTGEAEGKGEKLTGEVKKEPEVKGTSYEELRELVLRLASGGQREGIKAVSAKHGLGTPKDLLSDPNNYSSVANQATLEAVYADLQALEA